MKLVDIKFFDVRFPTSVGKHGSDAVHKNPDYSAAYVVLECDEPQLCGYGLTFTLGRGTEVVICAMNALKPFFVGKQLAEITKEFGKFWHDIMNEEQLRWLGPEKGVIHMAASGIFNAVWDLWAKSENKPLWKLLVNMSPQQLISCIDFTFIRDALTEENALLLLADADKKTERESHLLQHGFPAYSTSAGWIGYSDAEVTQKCRDAMAEGIGAFKIKVGIDKQLDLHRLKLIRDIVGPSIPIMTDANQCWSVQEAINWMIGLQEVKPYWIEEPTSCDDILGHAAIAKALNPLGILVATGEHAQNRVIFKQLITSGALQICQIDCCRLGSVNEVLAVILLAAKFNVPVCPHAGGVGLCQYVQHMIAFDYICVSGSTEGRMCEYTEHLHEHFVDPLSFKQGRYYPPANPGYGVQMQEESVEHYGFPDGPYWSRKTSDIA